MIHMGLRESPRFAARCADGVLELTLPKKTSGQGARQLDIQ